MSFWLPNPCAMMITGGGLQCKCSAVQSREGLASRRTSGWHAAAPVRTHSCHAAPYCCLLIASPRGSCAVAVPVPLARALRGHVQPRLAARAVAQKELCVAREVLRLLRLGCVRRLRGQGEGMGQAPLGRGCPPCLC